MKKNVAQRRHSVLNFTAWKVSKYGVNSGPYFPAFGLNTERYFVSLHIQVERRKIGTRINSVFWHFSRIPLLILIFIHLEWWELNKLSSANDPWKKLTVTLTAEKNTRTMNLLKRNLLNVSVYQKKLIDDVLENTSLKDVPFPILQSAREDDIISFWLVIGEVDEMFSNMESMNDAEELPLTLEFFQNYCTSRTCFWQVKKCTGLDFCAISHCGEIKSSA